MTWIGKIAGGLLGYAGGRLLGAVLGVILGHQFDRGLAGTTSKRRRSRRGSGASGPDRQRVFFEATFLVMGHLAKADGRVSEAEIAAARGVMQRLRLGDREARRAMELFNAGKQPDFPLEDQVARLRRACGGQPHLLQTFLEIQIDMVLAKGDITPLEREVLGRVADALAVGPMGLMRIEALLRARRRFGGHAPAARDDSLEKAYGVLGVPASASDSEVKLAYRRLMNEHHPDKQMARGLPESMLEIAKERTSEIRAAYETVRESRGFR